MKGRYIYSFMLSLATIMVVLILLAGCGKSSYLDKTCSVLLDSARKDLHDMDYGAARVKLEKVLERTGNKMYRVSADIRMMQICDILANNKDFYDYRGDAEKCMKMLADEEKYMDSRCLRRWHYIQTSYYRVLVAYFHHMRQGADLKAVLDTLSTHPEWSDADSLELIAQQRPLMLVQSQELITMADKMIDEGLYECALDSLEKVMHMINIHHLKYNKSVAKDDTLTLTGDIVNNKDSKEMQWLMDDNIIAVPEWMAILREHLSIVYAAIGDKQSSNYNRNIYFDILDATRQDMHMQQRKEQLQQEAAKMNLFIFLFIILAALILVAAFILTRRIGRKSKIKRDKLSHCLDICADMVNGKNVDDGVHALLPDINGDWTGSKVARSDLSSFDHELLSLLQVLNMWMKQNTEIYEAQTEQKESIEDEIYMEQRRMDENKRQHTDRATAISIVQGITPFLDRAIHLVENYSEEDSALLREYIEKINAYNDVLGHWVKVRQGSVALNIENFSMAPLLETLRKGHRAFDNKQISLTIEKMDAVVKADKALTLFMMNTLLDNARKYTPVGGCVALKVERSEDYVEVSVEDTGSGLTQEDQDKINNTKVYDSSQIGISNDTDGQIKQNKGFGFGLMNCRGIIEKYRKMGKMFDVCLFGVESTLGKGSRFFFRLPKGVMRTLALMVLLNINLDLSAKSVDVYVDSIIDANISGDYAKAVEYADSAITLLNESYTMQTGNTEPLMSLYLDSDYYPELDWFADSLDIDFNLIIQLRNEVSLAALSLADRPLYRYNNEVFIRLNKLVSQDTSMENDVRRLYRANANKNLILTLSFLLLLLATFLYALLYYRHTVLPVFNMRQLVEFLKRMFTAEGEQLPRLLRQGISNIRPADAVKLMMNDGIEYVDGEGEYKDEIPLEINFEGGEGKIGKMFIAYHGSKPAQEERHIIEFIAKFTAIHQFFSSVKIEEQLNNIELLEDRRFATETEQQRLHVQNMVMDNCLSTIKHETMYYPNRILQLLDNEDSVDINEIRDVLKYYREVFGILSENANRQLSRSVVKLKGILLEDVAQYAMKSFERQNKKKMLPLSFDVTYGDDETSDSIRQSLGQTQVRADSVLLQYLLDTLLSLVFERQTEGKIELNFDISARFVKFALSDSRLQRTEEENSRLFYADSMRYDPDSDTLLGVQYLIAKQIIRAHDERLGHLGCRIYAETNRLVFTLPII